MAKLSFPEALRRAGGPEASVWFLTTSDSRMLMDLVTTMEDRVVPEFRDFNYGRLACSRTTLAATALALCEELPVMVARRLVWLRDVHLLDRNQSNLLATGLLDIPPTTTVLMTAAPVRATAAGSATAGGGGADKGGTSAGGFRSSSEEDEAASSAGVEETASDSKAGVDVKKEGEGAGSGLKVLTTLAEKHGMFVAGSISHEELAAWLVEQASARGLQASQRVLQFMLERVGDDYTLLDGELDKLLCYVGPERTATEADVTSICVWSQTAKGYELTSAIDERDAFKALSIVHTLLEHDGHPLQILGLLGSHFRTLLKVRAMREAGASRTDIAARLKANEYRVKHLQRGEQRYQRPGLDLILDMLLRADEALKSGRNLKARVKGELVLETLILALCS